MFEPWQKFNAKKATTLMNQHRKTLAREHASLRKLLRQKKGQTPADLAERINALRRTWRKVVKDHTSVSRALIANCCTANFMNVLGTFVAHSFLGVTCDKVWQTLAEHSPSIGRPENCQPMGQTTYAPNLSQAKTIRDIEHRLSALVRKRLWTDREWWTAHRERTPGAVRAACPVYRHGATGRVPARVLIPKCETG